MKIPQYGAQSVGQYAPLPAARSGVVDVSGLTQGLQQGLNRYERGMEVQEREAEQQRKELAAVQRRERETLELNEAKSQVINTMSAADSFLYERFETARQAAPDDAKGFTDTLLKDFDTWADDRQGSASERARMPMKAELANLRERLHAKAFNFEVGQRNEALKNQFNDGLEEDKRNVYADPSQFAAIAKRRSAAADLIGVPASVREKMLDEARAELAWAAATKQATVDPVGFLKRAQKPGDDIVMAHLKPERLAVLSDRAQTDIARREQRAEMAAARAERLAERHMRQAQATFETFQAIADKGTAMDPGYLDRVMTQTAGTPYQGGVVALATQARDSGGLAAATIAQQQAAYDRVSTEIAQHGNSPERDKRRDQISKVLEGSRRDLESDGLRAGLERGVITAIPPLNMDAGAQGILQGMPQRVLSAQQVSAWGGKSVSPFTADESEKLRKSIAVLPWDQRSAFVATLAEAMGPQQAGAVAMQLDKKDRPTALAFALAGSKTSTGRFASELVFRGAAAQADGTSTKNEKAPDVKAAQWKRIVTQNLEGALPSATASEATRDAGLFIAHAIAAEKGGRLSDDDLKRAAELAVGGSILRHNGRQTVMPGLMDEDELDKRLRAISPQSVVAQTGPGSAKGAPIVRAGGVEVPVDEFLKTLPGAELIVSRRGVYQVLVSGRPVLSADGRRPIEIKISQ
jgi:hypothetical protein